MNPRYIIAILAILVSMALAACDKNILVEAKSLSYFSEHLSEADTVIAKCEDLKKNEVSRMSNAQRFEWEGQPQGINCRNARKARSDSNYQAAQQRMRETAKKFE